MGTMSTQVVKAGDVEIGDTIVFHDTRFNFVVEDITVPTPNGIIFHYSNHTELGPYRDDEKLSVIRRS